jgi:hypothetical protein
MTDRDATQLRIELDAMRMARAEDHRSCARLTARVKELEAEVASLKHAKDWWMGKTAECADAVLRAGKPSDGERMEALTALLEADKAKLAEGTRDETVRRCTRCNCPVDPSEPACVTFCRICILAVADEQVR